MRAPTDEELAAIAAAYRAVSRSAAAQAAETPSRWRVAGRLPVADAPQARTLLRAASRWSMSGRLDD